MAPNVRRLTIITAVIAVAIAIGFVLWQQRPEPAGATEVDFRLDEQPILGDPNAPATIIAFEDFMCPVCRRFEETVFPRIEQELVATGEANMAFINFQFIGPGSTTAGIAGECAYEQDPEAFWDYKTIIYRAQGPESEDWATPERLVELASYQGSLDTEALAQCIEERRYADEVRQDYEIAVAAGATGTPTVLVDGRKLSGWDFETIRAAVEEAQP